MITIREAKQIAKDWVEAEAPNITSFRGSQKTRLTLSYEQETGGYGTRKTLRYAGRISLLMTRGYRHRGILFNCLCVSPPCSLYDPSPLP